MPVNTASLKTFAPAMRRQLLEAVGRKLDLLLHSQTPDTLSTYAEQIAELRDQEAENREQLLERVAYTWFNRLCALRYLDAKGWHPFGCKVLMPAAEGETQPELLKLMRAGSLPAELKPHTNEARLHGLLDGQIPPAIAGADPQGEVYRELVLASCRSYHQLLPDLFEGLDDASELLLPDDLLSEGSIAGSIRSAISDEDCEDVEIIGWLYQFYISEKKDQVIGKVVKSEDIPAATQLFTPNWIVKYMVQNTLGATWLATYPDSPVKAQMEFYIEPAVQTPEAQAQLSAITPESLDPETLTLIDPACGSGHILVEAYDLLKAIYLERGYRQRDIPELILTKNLFGLDICPRAAQLAAFSLLMKGREDDRRLLERGLELNVIAFQDSKGLSLEHLATRLDLASTDLMSEDLQMLRELFTRSTTLGSLIKVPDYLAEKLPSLSVLSTRMRQDLLGARDGQRLHKLARQASLLARQYSSIVTNPPYMGSNFHAAEVKSHLRNNFPEYSKDLFSAFVIRSQAFLASGGRSGFMTPMVWMFLGSHAALRQNILEANTLCSLIHLEYNASGAVRVPLCTFTTQRSHIPKFSGSYIRLTEFGGENRQGPKALEAINNRKCGWMYETRPDDFMKLPGSPIAYWIGPRTVEIFEKSEALSESSELKNGLQTSDNDRFLRLWHEVSASTIGFSVSSRHEAKTTGRRWFPTNKGGSFRKWYGNHDFVVNWQNDGEDLFNFRPQSVIRNPEYYFREAISWSNVTSSINSFRYYPPGFIANIAAPSAFGGSRLWKYALAAYCNGNFITGIAQALNPSLNFTTGDFGALPYAFKDHVDVLGNVGEACIQMARNDWDAFERAWTFRSLPLLAIASGIHQKLGDCYEQWISLNKGMVIKMKELEEESNSLFINAYNLGSELTSDIPISQITLTVNPAYRYGGRLSENEQWERFRRDTMAELLSYATGCMMGRYSLDQPGLILADSRDSQAEQLAAYEAKVGKPLSEAQFKPDPDGIIPVLDGEWFEDDIVARTREFLAVTFPESSIAENLRFIEESLGKEIRKYFCSDFYKDHLQTYKKRPIYWMVQSPKKGFACLIYLHRYTKDTLNQVLNNYFRPYLQKLEARLAQLGLDQLNDDLPARERTAARKEAEKITKVLKECQAWEQDALLPLAQQRIELDLDDGVKVNYLKLQDVLAPIPGLAAKED